MFILFNYYCNISRCWLLILYLGKYISKYTLVSTKRFRYNSSTHDLPKTHCHPQCDMWQASHHSAICPISGNVVFIIIITRPLDHRCDKFVFNLCTYYYNLLLSSIQSTIPCYLLLIKYISCMFRQFTANNLTPT